MVKFKPHGREKVIFGFVVRKLKVLIVKIKIGPVWICTTLPSLIHLS